MNKSLTEIIFILDKSGSMESIRKETIDGFNMFLANQKELLSDIDVTAVLSNNYIEILYNGSNIDEVKKLTYDNYIPGGTTALYDAIGFTLIKVGQRLSDTFETSRPSKVIVVIMTDGLENASKNYNKKMIRDMIKHQKDKYSWEFIFLGANFDAEKFAEEISIEKENAATFDYSKDGMEMNFMAINEAVKLARMSPQEKINSNWKNKIKQK